ncbi:MAG: shikimate kinase [Clostridia bacterium]|nr:shikimate kinase [Clostridia bacterium]
MMETMQKGFSSLRCGLIGEHLGHSFSAPIHALLADYSYEICELAPHEVGDFVKNSRLDAFNVTIPYKETVLPYLDTISPEAKRIGSVNTVVRRANGQIDGYNTDYFGFDAMLTASGIPVQGKKTVVLGTGGASKTVQTVLSDRGVGELVVVGRTSENNYENLYLHYDADLIVNTTPVGMYPKNGQTPIDLSHFRNCKGVLDLIYNPAKTALLLKAEELGISAMNGLYMLVAQAVKAFEFFTGESAKAGVIETITKRIASRTRNIILIGMPGCGKSTVGKILAEQLDRSFLDADEEFFAMHGITPADAIKTLGEDCFREMEHEVLYELGKKSGTVIATGGGAVTRSFNYEPLHQNGTIIYLRRDLSKLSKKDRPLSQSTSPEELYNKRKVFYEAFADLTIDSTEIPEQTAARMLAALEMV